MASIFDILAQDYTDPRGRFNVGRLARNFTKSGRQDIDAQKELENAARQTALMQQRQEQGVMGQITPGIDPRVTSAKQGAFRFGEEQGAAGILNQGNPGAFAADMSRAGLAEQQAVTEGRGIQNTFNKRSMPFALNDLNELQRRFGFSNPQPLFESQRIGQGQQTIDLQRTGQGLDESYRRDVMARDVFDKNRDRPLNDLQTMASTGYMGMSDPNIMTALRNMMVQRGFIPQQQPNQEPGLISSAANQVIGETDNKGRQPPFTAQSQTGVRAGEITRPDVGPSIQFGRSQPQPQAVPQSPTGMDNLLETFNDGRIQPSVRNMTSPIPDANLLEVLRMIQQLQQQGLQ